MIREKLYMIFIVNISDSVSEEGDRFGRVRPSLRPLL